MHFLGKILQQQPVAGEMIASNRAVALIRHTPLRATIGSEISPILYHRPHMKFVFVHTFFVAIETAFRLNLNVFS